MGYSFLFKIRKRKQNCFVLAKRSYPNNVDVQRQYKACCKTERNLRRSLIKHFASNINKAQGDSRLIWRTLNQITSRKSSHPPFLVTKLTIDGGTVTDPEIISNSFNYFFFC